MSFRIRTRLVAWYVLLLGAILAGLSAFLLLRLRADLVTGIDRSLDGRAAQISLGYQGRGEGEFQDVADATLVNLPQGEHGAQILSSNGAVMESSGDPVAEVPLLSGSAARQVLLRGPLRTTVSAGADGEPFRVLALPAPRRPKSEVLLVATSLEDVNASVHRLFLLILTAGPAALAAAALVGWWLARRALQPVAQMTEQAATIGMERLDERVPVPAVDDELAALARTLNDMLDRLQRGVDRTRRFVADASHELRTPLAVMRSELEVSLRSPDHTEAARTVLGSAAEEVDRMTRMVENLLILARLDEGKLELLPVPVDLRDLADRAVAELEPLAAGRGVATVIEGQHTEVEGDRERLRQVVVNLVDNAVKHTSRGGTVRVSIEPNGSETVLAVSDTGSGIPADSLPHVFDRFFRVDRSRSRSDGGAGLGLAICRDIVEAHGGRIWVQSEVGHGSVFSIALPRDASSMNRE